MPRWTKPDPWGDIYYPLVYEAFPLINRRPVDPILGLHEMLPLAISVLENASPAQLSVIAGLHSMRALSMSVVELRALLMTTLLNEFHSMRTVVPTAVAVTSLQFTATDSYVDCGLYTSLNAATSVSWTYWAQPVDTAARIQWARQAPQFNFSTNATNRFMVAFTGTAGGDASNSWLSASGQLVTEDVWTHLCVTYNGAGSGNAGKLKIYKNGADISAAGAYTGNMGTALGSFVGGAAQLRFGWDGVGTKFSGRMMRAAIWPARVLSAAEVLEIYTAGRGADIASTSLGNPTNYWKLAADYQDTGTNGLFDGAPNGTNLNFSIG